MYQAEKKAAKDKDEMDHKMRLARMRENNARRGSDVKVIQNFFPCVAIEFSAIQDVIRKARSDAATAASNQKSAGARPAPIQVPAINQAILDRRKQRVASALPLLARRL